MNARISANADAAASAFAPQSSCAEIIFLIADASTDTREEETMNKKTLRRALKKAATIPEREELIRLEARRELADELMLELRCKSEKELTLGFETPIDDGVTALVHYKKAMVLEWVMSLICGKVYEK